MHRERIRSIIYPTNCENCKHPLKVVYSWDDESKGFIPTEFYDRFDINNSIELDYCPECNNLLEM